MNFFPIYVITPKDGFSIPKKQQPILNIKLKKTTNQHTKKHQTIGLFVFEEKNLKINKYLSFKREDDLSWAISKYILPGL